MPKQSWLTILPPNLPILHREQSPDEDLGVPPVPFNSPEPGNCMTLEISDLYIDTHHPDIATAREHFEIEDDRLDCNGDAYHTCTTQHPRPNFHPFLPGVRIRKNRGKISPAKNASTKRSSVKAPLRGARYRSHGSAPPAVWVPASSQPFIHPDTRFQSPGAPGTFIPVLASPFRPPPPNQGFGHMTQAQFSQPPETLMTPAQNPVYNGFQSNSFQQSGYRPHRSQPHGP